MTAEEARIITKRAVIMKYVMQIDNLIRNTADKGEYMAEYTHQTSGGYTRAIETTLATELIDFYTKNGFNVNFKKDSKSTLQISWYEKSDNTKTDESLETKTVEPQIKNDDDEWQSNTNAPMV